MSVLCPNGHQSGDAEWCDTCGARIGGEPDPAPVAASPAPPVGTASATTPAGVQTDCPHCGSFNESTNLFCEQCGYDFTTGQAPPRPPDEAAPEAAAATLDSTVAWIVVVEVDRAWYELKGSLADQPCPPSSSSTVALAQHTALIGRSSRSRGIHPEIALDGDTGVSRRHAQFVRDGDELAIIDLSSTNGTYVVAAGGEPDAATAALAAGPSTPLHDGDRVYLGAWTRLTVRLS